MSLGTIYIVFFGGEFLGQFQGFLMTLGVPVAAWCGVMLADVLLRRRDYAEHDLYRPAGRYGDVRFRPIAGPGRRTALGWGLVRTRPPSWLELAGLPPRPVRPRRQDGAWAYANLGVLVALALGFLGTASRVAPRRVRAAGGGREVRGAVLAVIDLQHVFADPASPWFTPRFAEVVPPVPAW